MHEWVFETWDEFNQWRKEHGENPKKVEGEMMEQCGALPGTTIRVVCLEHENRPIDRTTGDE